MPCDVDQGISSRFHIPVTDADAAALGVDDDSRIEKGAATTLTARLDEDGWTALARAEHHTRSYDGASRDATVESLDPKTARTSSTSAMIAWSYLAQDQSVEAQCRALQRIGGAFCWNPRTEAIKVLITPLRLRG